MNHKDSHRTLVQLLHKVQQGEADTKTIEAALHPVVLWNEQFMESEMEPLWVPYAFKLTKVLISGIIFVFLYLKNPSSLDSHVRNANRATNIFFRGIDNL